MTDHKPELFGLMGSVRCAACDETWPCEVSQLRAALVEASLDFTVIIEAAKSVGNTKLADTISGFAAKVDAALNQQQRNIE